MLSAAVAQFGLGDFFGRLLFLYQQGGIDLLTNDWARNYSWTFVGSIGWMNVLGLIWVAGLVILLIMAVVFVTITAQGALVAYAANYFKDKKFNNLAKAWHKSVGHFWQLLKVNILYKLIFCALLLSSAAVIKFWYLAETAIMQIVLGVVLGLLLFLYLVFSIIYFYVIAYVVIDNQIATRAARLAWRLFDRHILVSVEIGLVMLFLNLFLILAGATALLLAFLPAVIIWIVAGIFGFTKLVAGGLAVGLFIWLVLILLLAAVFNVFNTAAWVCLFMKMRKEGIVSRIVGHVGRIFGI